MPRTFPELLREMERLTKGLPDAWKLTKRFKARVLPLLWESDDVYDAEALLYTDLEADMQDHVLLIFLPEGCKPPPKDGLVWQQGLSDGVRRRTVLIVDAVSCHPDWIALKTVYEFGHLEIDEHIRDMAPAIRTRLPGLSDGELSFQLAGASGFLSARLDVLTARLMDRRMRGRLTAEVKRIKRASLFQNDEASLVESLAQQMFYALDYTWPDPANARERRARNLLLASAARGLMFRDFNPPPQI